MNSIIGCQTTNSLFAINWHLHLNISSYDQQQGNSQHFRWIYWVNKYITKQVFTNYIWKEHLSQKFSMAINKLYYYTCSDSGSSSRLPQSSVSQPSVPLTSIVELALPAYTDIISIKIWDKAHDKTRVEKCLKSTKMKQNIVYQQCVLLNHMIV